MTGDQRTTYTPPMIQSPGDGAVGNFMKDKFVYTGDFVKINEV